MTGQEMDRQDRFSKWLLYIVAALGVVAVILFIISMTAPKPSAQPAPSSPPVSSEPMNAPPVVKPMKTPPPLEPNAATPDNPVTGCVVIPGVQKCKPLNSKDPSQDPVAQGNAPLGGGANYCDSPGKYIAPEDVVHPPSTPRVNPEPPQAAPAPSFWDWLVSLFGGQQATDEPTSVPMPSPPAC